MQVEIKSKPWITLGLQKQYLKNKLQISLLRISH